MGKLLVCGPGAAWVLWEWSWAEGFALETRVWLLGTPGGPMGELSSSSGSQKEDLKVI